MKQPTISLTVMWKSVIIICKEGAGSLWLRSFRHHMMWCSRHCLSEIPIYLEYFFYLDCAEYHSSYSIREDKRFDKLTDKLSIHIFELPKVPKERISSDNKQMRMELIKADSEEALEMVRTTTQDPAIQKGIDAVYALIADTVLREKIRQRDKAIRDYENDMAAAKSEGMAEESNSIAENMRKNSFTEEQIKLALGDAYDA